LAEDDRERDEFLPEAGVGVLTSDVRPFKGGGPIDPSIAERGFVIEEVDEEVPLVLIRILFPSADTLGV